MNFVLLLVLLVTGFIVAPFASLAVQERPWRRLAAALLLVMTLLVLGYLAFAFDGGIMPPRSWISSGACVLAGVGICIYVFVLHKFRLALVAGGILVATILALHFFALNLNRACQHACLAVQKGMTADQVTATILRAFADRPDYRAVVESKVILPDEAGFIIFDLRPQWVELKRGHYIRGFQG
jgi:hypothetical protein